MKPDMAFRDIPAVLTLQCQIFPSERASKPRTQGSFEVHVNRKTNSTLPALHYVSRTGHTVAFVVSTRPKPDVHMGSFQTEANRDVHTGRRSTWWQVSERRGHGLKTTARRIIKQQELGQTELQAWGWKLKERKRKESNTCVCCYWKIINDGQI